MRTYLNVILGQKHIRNNVIFTIHQLFSGIK